MYIIKPKTKHAIAKDFLYDLKCFFPYIHVTKLMFYFGHYHGQFEGNTTTIKVLLHASMIKNR